MERFWHELTDDELPIIKEKDRPRTSVIKGIPSELRHKIYLSLDYLTSDPHYEQEQWEWFDHKIDFSNKRERRDTSHDSTFIQDIICGPIREEFRIDYALRNLNKVKQPWTDDFANLFAQVKYAELAKNN